MDRSNASEEKKLSEVSSLLHSVGTSVREEWQYRLAEPGAGLVAKKLHYVTKSITSGSDALSLVIENLRIGQLRNTNVSQILPRINEVDYSIEDFSIELTVLKGSIYTVLEKMEGISTEEKFSAFSTVSFACDCLLQDVMHPTSVVYEQVIESGARGFVRVDEDGIIIYVNKKMRDIAGDTHLIGKSVYDYFYGEDARYIRDQLINNDTPKKSILRKMRWTAVSGQITELNSEVVPIALGGYLYFSELSFILEAQTQIYDKHPFAIVELDANLQITYANPVSCRLLGVTEFKGSDYREFIAENQDDLIAQQMERRRRGITDTYNLWLRNKKTGRKFEVRVVSVPHFDQAGGYVGVFVILEPLDIKKVIEKIEQLTAGSIDQAEYCEDGIRTLFSNVFETLKTLFNAEVFFVSLLSKDNTHVRAIYENSGAPMATRWFLMSDELRRWNNQEKVTAIGDLEEFLREHDPEMLNDGVVQYLISQNLLSWLRYPIHEEGRVIAMVSLAAKGKHCFTDNDEETIVRIPLDRALMKALFFERQKELQLVNQLTREVQGSTTPAEIGERLCSLLAKNYGWQNVSFFGVDRKLGKFKLISQGTEAETGFEIPNAYEQPLDEGVLGTAYREDATILVNDVANDPVYSSCFLRTNESTQSELCVPVHHRGTIYGVINLEHSQINAFALDDQELLEEIVTEVEKVLERLWWQHQLNAAFNQVSDPVFFVDDEGKIRSPNRAAVDLFSVEDGQPFKVFGQYFDEGDAANRILLDAGDVEYAGKFRVDGVRMYTTFNKVRMPSSFDGYLCTLKNISAATRQIELENIRLHFMDLAREVKTPISLVSSWLDRLQTTLAGPDELSSRIRVCEDLVSKIKTQMQDIDLGYDSFLYNDDDLLSASAPVNFAISKLLNRSLCGFPVCVRDSIQLEIGEPEPMVFGHLDALSFAVKSIFSFLFRYAQDDTVMTMSARNKDDTYVELEISERLRDRVAQHLPGVLISDSAMSAEPGYHDLSSGDVLIRRIVDLHEGKYRKRKNAQGLWSFQLEVPWATAGTRG